MAVRAISPDTKTSHDIDRHPKGLYVLFATEMWERFSFYTMVSMFTLYLRDPTEGFAWTAALACLVIGNGFFKPNVSTMVGNLYPDGSHLKDRAYNLFYMGINIGAFLAPVVATIVQAKFGFHPAFAVAAFGMVISVTILWR